MIERLASTSSKWRRRGEVERAVGVDQEATVDVQALTWPIAP